MKMSKRVKINFKTVIGENYKVIPKCDLADTNERVRKAMKEFLMSLKKKGVSL